MSSPPETEPYDCPDEFVKCHNRSLRFVGLQFFQTPSLYLFLNNYIVRVRATSSVQCIAPLHFTLKNGEALPIQAFDKDMNSAATCQSYLLDILFFGDTKLEHLWLPI